MIDLNLLENHRQHSHLNRTGRRYRLLLKKQAIKTSDKRIFIIQKEMIIGYLTEHATAKTSEIADALNISAPRARAVLSRLLSEDIIIGEGANRNRTYRLKS